MMRLRTKDDNCTKVIGEVNGLQATQLTIVSALGETKASQANSSELSVTGIVLIPACHLNQILCAGTAGQLQYRSSKYHPYGISNGGCSPWIQPICCIDRLKPSQIPIVP